MSRKNDPSKKASKGSKGSKGTAGSRSSRSRIAKMVESGSAVATKDDDADETEDDAEEQEPASEATNTGWKADGDDHAAGDDFDSAMDEATKAETEERQAVTTPSDPKAPKTSKEKKEPKARGPKNVRIAGTPDDICGMPVPPSGKPCVLAPGHAKGHSCHSDHAKDADRAIHSAARLMREATTARLKVEDLAYKMGESQWSHFCLTRGFGDNGIFDILSIVANKQVEEEAAEQTATAS